MYGKIAPGVKSRLQKLHRWKILLVMMLLQNDCKWMYDGIGNVGGGIFFFNGWRKNITIIRLTIKIYSRIIAPILILGLLIEIFAIMKMK